VAAKPDSFRTIATPTSLWEAGVVIRPSAEGWRIVRVVDNVQLAVISATGEPTVCALILEAAGVERALVIGRTMGQVVTSVCFSTLRVRWRHEATAPAVGITDGLWAAEAVGQFDIVTLISAATSLTVRLDARRRRPNRLGHSRIHG